MSTNCQTNVSLIKDYVPVRIVGINTVRQAFKTLMKIFKNTMGKLRVTAVLEIVFNSCMTVSDSCRAAPIRYRTGYIDRDRGK